MQSNFYSKTSNGMNKISQQRGFMQIVLLAIIIIAGLAYFNIDLRTIFENPIVHKIVNILIVVWVSSIKPLIMYLWTNIGVLPPAPTV